MWYVYKAMQIHDDIKSSAFVAGIYTCTHAPLHRLKIQPLTIIIPFFIWLKCSR